MKHEKEARIRKEREEASVRHFIDKKEAAVRLPEKTMENLRSRERKERISGAKMRKTRPASLL